MKRINKYLLVVGGPTAAGKTGLAIGLAQHFDTEVLSADSRQFYQEMEIGTARPTTTELAAAKHHFVADRSINKPLNAGQFAREALEVLSHLYQQKDCAVLVGGSGLFIKALCEGLDSFPKVPKSIRTEVSQLFQKGGLAALQTALEKCDPDYYAIVDQQNPVRLQRAIEVSMVGDQPYSYYLGQQAQKRPFIPIYVQPSWPREELYARINQRVDVMMSEGLVAEARDLWSQQHLSALQTVGYQEWFDHFKGKTDHATAVSLVKQNSRRYAKRQLTWNRRDGHWKAIPKADLRSALAYIQLVKDEGLYLAKIRIDENVKYISEKEQKRGLGLSKSNGQMVAKVAWASVKNWAWLHNYVMGDLSHLATMILLHETVQRTEVPTVYVQLENKETIAVFEQLGFKVIDSLSLPDKLPAKLNIAIPVWKWERVGQLF